MTRLHLYVYYRVAPANVMALHTAVRRMQAALRQTQGQPQGQTHQQGFHLRRRTAVDEAGHETWMEVYENVPSGFEVTLNTAVEQARLMQWISGPRHIEHFRDLETG